MTKTSLSPRAKRLLDSILENSRLTGKRASVYQATFVSRAEAYRELVRAGYMEELYGPAVYPSFRQRMFGGGSHRVYSQQRMQRTEQNGGSRRRRWRKMGKSFRA
jgi:hypothetical protein